MRMLPSTWELLMLSCVFSLLIVHLPQNTAAQDQEELRHYPWYRDYDAGYVPSDLSSPYEPVWWNKRVRRDGEDPIPDYPLTVDDIDDEMQHLEGGIQKRDYTAAQLLSMLKQLAKNRKHRQIRIAGKSLRFGISRK